MDLMSHQIAPQVGPLDMVSSLMPPSHQGEQAGMILDVMQQLQQQANAGQAAASMYNLNQTTDEFGQSARDR